MPVGLRSRSAFKSRTLNPYTADVGSPDDVFIAGNAWKALKKTEDVSMSSFDAGGTRLSSIEIK
jgi:hypothetical protein